MNSHTPRQTQTPQTPRQSQNQDPLESPSPSSYRYPPRPRPPRTQSQTRTQSQRRPHTRRSSSLSNPFGISVIPLEEPYESDEDLDEPRTRRPRPSTSRADSASISNRKLAQNQQALSAQIDELGKVLVAMRKEMAELRRNTHTANGNASSGGISGAMGPHEADLSVLGQDGGPL